MNNQKDLSNNRDVVLYFSAGAMAGIFSAGFASVLEKHELRNRIDKIYGNSAGSLAALHFIAGQSEKGAEMYWKKLSATQYIHWDRLYSYFFKGLANKIFGTSFNILPVFDIDYIQNLLEGEYKIPYKKIEESEITISMIAYNIDSRQHDYLTPKHEGDMLPMLRATAGGQPAYHKLAEVGSQRYIDGGTINDKRRIERIIGSNPGRNILCVLNNPKFEGGAIKILIDKLLMALVMVPFFGFKEAVKTARSDFGNLEVKDLEILFPHVYFIANDILGKQLSTDPHDHKRLYLRGQELAQEFLESDRFRQMRPICK